MRILKFESPEQFFDVLGSNYDNHVKIYRQKKIIRERLRIAALASADVSAWLDNDIAQRRANREQNR